MASIRRSSSSATRTSRVWSRSSRTLFYGRLLENIGDLNLVHDFDPFDHLAEDGVLAVPLGMGLGLDEELAVGSFRIGPRVCHGHRAAHVPPLLRDFSDANHLAAAHASPVIAVRHVAGLG